jgi:hypothetical protein
MAIFQGGVINVAQNIILPSLGSYSVSRFQVSATAFPVSRRRLRQDVASFLIKLAASAASGWANRRTAEYRTAACDELSRVEFRRMESLRSVS